MEQVRGRSKASNFVSEDFFRRMPDFVITNILDRLPLQDAVKTGTLSRNWRFKWTTMCTHAVFDTNFFQYLLNTGKSVAYDGRLIISRILLQLKGPIRKFHVHIYEECFFEDIGTWVMCLSQKGIEEFTLFSFSETELVLPTHLFSCLKLKHLNLKNCCFPLMPGSHGFPNLLSLKLHQVRDEYNCGEFLNQSPLLEILENTGNSLGTSSILQLLGVFSKLRELTFGGFRNCKLLAKNGSRKMVPVTLHCLKTLTLHEVDFSSAVSVSVSCAIELICASPNLQTLHIYATYKANTVPSPAFCSGEVDFGGMRMLRLWNVELKYIRSSENEVCFIKSLLLSSPFLKNMGIRTIDSYDHKKSMPFATKLLTLHRASPIAAIYLR